MPRHLIIQLARFGDLMQTAPLVSAAVGDEVHLLVDSSLESAAGMIDGVTWVHTFDRTAFSKELNQNDVTHAYQRVSALAQALQANNFDKVSNITHTAESAYLTGLAVKSLPRRTDISVCRGMTGGRKGTYSAGNWSRLFRALLCRRELGAFHLVDLHLKLAGLGSPNRGKSWLKATSPASKSDYPLLTIQLGANSPLRMWEPANFAATARIVAEALPGLQIALVGSKDELALATEFERVYGSTVQNFVGKTNLQELAEVIARSSLVLSGDTGTIHLAAALNVPTVGIYLGMARADDTAPYRTGSVIFESRRACYPCAENNRCGHVSCHSDIPPVVVAADVVQLLSGRKVTPQLSDSFQSRIVEFDEDGCLDLMGATVSTQPSRRQTLRKFWLKEFGQFPSDHESENFNHSTRDLAELTGAALSAARRFELALIGGNQIEKARELLKLNLKDIELAANQPDESGLLAHLFQLELEDLPEGPKLIAGKIKLSLENLYRRARLYPPRQSIGILPLRAATR